MSYLHLNVEYTRWTQNYWTQNYIAPDVTDWYVCPSCFWVALMGPHREICPRPSDDALANMTTLFKACLSG